MLGRSTLSYVQFTEPIRKSAEDLATLSLQVSQHLYDTLPVLTRTVSFYPANFFLNFLHPNYFRFSYIRIISGFPTSGLSFPPLCIRFLSPFAISATSFLLLPLTSFFFYLFHPSCPFFPISLKTHPPDTFVTRYNLCPIQFVSDTNCADTICADTICT